MFTLPDLPYATSALEPHLDAATMEIHHGKHHAAYVKNLNDALAAHDDLLNLPVDELLRHLDQVPQELRTKVRNQGGGHANHSLFWAIMSPDGGGQPGGDLAAAISSSFGSFEEFKNQFTAAATSVFGSGWAWLVAVDHQLTIITKPNQDSPLSDGQTPILGLDVWEHAYYLHYQNRRLDYITAWWNVVAWDAVSQRYELAQK